MIRLLAAALLLLAPVAAQAAERTYSVGSFERIRVDGPFEVRLTSGASASARAESDPRTLEQLSVAVEGSTLVIQMGGKGWGETPKAVAVPPVITLSTPMLRSILVNSGARLTVSGMRSQRVDMSINGSGTLSVSGIDADDLFATVIGSGSITLAGRSARARLLVNGSGVFDASKLQVGDLNVRLDGTGQINAAARYTAKVATTGLGAVTVAGEPKCTVTAVAGGPVSCGKLPQP